MNVLVDTSVWSHALRRARPGPANVVQELTELVHEGRVVIMGSIRQELLSGLKDERQFQHLREHLRAFPDLPVDSTDYEEAARWFNRCRAKGIQGSNTDFVMCAVAMRADLTIFTTDDDFDAFRRVIPVRMHTPRG